MRRWIDIIKHAPRANLKESAGEFDGYLYHASPERYVESITREGILPTSYWGTERIAEYYAEDIRENGEEAHIFRVPFRDFDEANLEPDLPGLEEPLTYTLGMSEEEVWDEWADSAKDWNASLEIVGSVRYTGIVRPVPLTEEAVSHKEYNLAAKFDHFNKLCFDRTLPKVPIRWGTLKTALGVCKASIFVPPEYREEKREIQRAKAILLPETVNIVMNDAFVREEEKIDAILVHEMIHAWLYFNGDLWEQHGSKFLAKLRDCEARSGLDIPLSENMKDAEFADHVDLSKKHYVLIMTRDTSPPCYAIINPTIFKRLEDAMRHDWWNKGVRGATLTAWETASEAWNKKAQNAPLQRPKTVTGYKGGVKWFYIKDGELLRDLEANGKKLFSVANEPRF
jgi:hypothetical protein